MFALQAPAAASAASASSQKLGRAIALAARWSLAGAVLTAVVRHG